MKRILIAGAAGYVGQNLIRALGEKAEITGVDLKAGYVHPDELSGIEGPFDVFYNLAWVGKGGALRGDCRLQTENVLTALAYYEAALRLGCRRYICAGTIGELMVELPECAKLHSQNFAYLHAKNYLRKLLRSIETPERCQVVWARLGNLYGGGDSGGNLVAYTMAKLAKGEKAIFGPAEQPYDFMHAQDASRALAALGMTEELVSSEFYLGSGDVRPLKDFLVAIGRIMGREELLSIGGRADDGTRYLPEWFSIEKLVSETGYAPMLRFEEGIRKLNEANR